MSQYKLDIHAHIMPGTWPSLKEKYGYGGFIQLVDEADTGAKRMMRDDGVFFRRVEQNCYDPEAILNDMDENGVSKMVLCNIPVLFYYWAKPQHTLEWSQFLNDFFTQIQDDYPDRFVGLGTLPMQDVGLAIKELERCKALGLPGVEIGSHIEKNNLDHPDYFPFWEAAQDLDMAIFIHPWEMMGQADMQKYWLPWLVGMPAETSRAICSMMFGGVFDKFPNLRVMFAHGGGSFAHTLGRISHGWHCRPDLVNINDVADPYDYRGKFWVDGITHDKDALRYLISVMGEDRISYGTDYPFPLGDLQHGRFIQEMDDLSQATKDKLFFQNALEFLGIN
ncbi:MAG: amidohydrolase [Flavobacteriales bacterium]|nr:amidohydrolase [Bacteroidota bacterium]MCB9240905.1 amidohydrolase [Flavobacteriales bacterium]